MMALYTNRTGLHFQLFIDSVMRHDSSVDQKYSDLYLLYYQIGNNDVISNPSSNQYTYAVPINALTFQSSIELRCGLYNSTKCTLKYSYRLLTF